MSNLTKKGVTSFTGDEKLAEQVKRFSCLYNKSAEIIQGKTSGEKYVVRSSIES